MPFSHENDQRSVPRWPVAFVGHCYGVHGSSRCFISELGQAGLRFATGVPFKVGDEVVIGWILNDQRFQITGIVRHVCGDGAGLEFFNISQTERLQLLEYLRRRGCEASARSDAPRPQSGTK